MFGFGGLELMVMPLALVGIVVLAIVALAGSRGEADPQGRRAPVLYLSLISFVAIFTLVYAVPSVVAAIANLAITDVEDDDLAEICAEGPVRAGCEAGVSRFGNPFEPSSPDAKEAAWARDAFNGLAVAVAAAAVLWWHRRRWARILGDETSGSSPGGRTHNAYLHAVLFTAMIVLLAAGAAVLFALARVAVPGVVSEGSSAVERDAGLVQLLSALATGGAAAFVYVTHWRRTRTPGPAPGG